MDYSTIPTALIYQKKTLNQISKLHELNRMVLQNMLDIESLHDVDFEKFVLPCFNNAYYICTLMRMENNAEYRLNSYKKIALNGNAKNTLAQCVTLSLVAILTEHCSQSWREKLLGVSNKLKDHAKGLWIERQNEILFPFSSPGDKPVYNNEMVHLIGMYEAMSRGIDEKFVLSDELFSPRPIDEKALRDLGREDYHFEWAKWTQYYDEDIVRELVEGLGATQQDKAILIRSLWEKSNSYYVGDYPKQYVEPLLKSLAEKFCPDCLQMTELYLDESTGTMTPETPLPSHQAPATASPVPSCEQQSIIEQQATRIKDLTAELEELKQKIAQTAGDNRQVWIDWLDWDVFHPSIKVEEVYKTIDKNATPELGEKAKCYAFYRVLNEIKWLKKGTAQKDVLKWWSAHFGCEWHSDNQLKFTTLPDAITHATTTDQWKYCGGYNNEYYYNYAYELKKAFAWNKGQGQYETKPQFVKAGCLPPEKCK